MTGTLVMLVDDDPFIREVVSAALGYRPGVSVQAFAAAADALAAAPRVRPDILVLDYSLPGTKGLTLARDLRGVLMPMPLLIFLTAWDDADLVRRLRTEGVVIAKPFDPATIAQQILAVREPIRDTRLDAVAASFRASLPQTMAEIETELAIIQRDWQRTVAQSIAMRVHKLAGAAGLFKLHDFGTAARDVEAAINVQLQAEDRGESPQITPIARAIALLRQRA